jgi:hypothetical protein
MFGAESALGKTLLIGKTPVEIIGVIKDTQHQSGGALSVWLPYSAVHANLTGTSHLDSIVLRLAEGSAFGEAEKEIAATLLERMRSINHVSCARVAGVLSVTGRGSDVELVAQVLGSAIVQGSRAS